VNGTAGLDITGGLFIVGHVFNGYIDGSVGFGTSTAAQVARITRYMAGGATIVFDGCDCASSPGAVQAIATAFGVPIIANRGFVEDIAEGGSV